MGKVHHSHSYGLNLFVSWTILHCMSNMVRVWESKKNMEKMPSNMLLFVCLLIRNSVWYVENVVNRFARNVCVDCYRLKSFPKTSSKPPFCRCKRFGINVLRNQLKQLKQRTKGLRLSSCPVSKERRFSI